MSERSSPVTDRDREPHHDPELHEIRFGYTWKFSDAASAARVDRGPPEPDGGDEMERLRAQVRHLTAALEDVVAQARSVRDHRERAMRMHRRAVAALSALPGRSAAHGENS